MQSPVHAYIEHTSGRRREYTVDNYQAIPYSLADMDAIALTSPHEKV